MENSIACPKCGAEIPLTEAVSRRVREQLEADFNRRLAESNAALAERERKVAAERAALEQRRNAVELEVARRVQAERDQLLGEARRQAESALADRLKALQDQVAEKEARLRQAREIELDLLKQKAALETARAEMELTLARRLDAERQRIADAARAQAVEAERLKIADKEKIITDLQREIQNLKQKAEQGSMQLQGESLEITLEADLKAAFPADDIREVRKGHRGADIMQRVGARADNDSGLILWEAKRARNWSADWPEKLKDDQRGAGADLAVIVTTCPPPGLRGIGQHEGVWVAEPPFAVPLAAALRQGLIGAAAQRAQQANRADKAQLLYDHVCSIGFRQHIQAIVETFIGLRNQLEAEQRAFARQWKEREEQLRKAVTHVAMLYGGIQGIAGREALPEVPSLALPGTMQDAAGHARPAAGVSPERENCRPPTSAASPP